MNIFKAMLTKVATYFFSQKDGKAKGTAEVKALEPEIDQVAQTADQAAAAEVSSAASKIKL